MAKKKARVLVDCVYGKCNDVVEIDEKADKEAVLSGLLDDNQEAVKYAQSLKKK